MAHGGEHEKAALIAAARARLETAPLAIPARRPRRARSKRLESAGGLNPVAVIVLYVASSALNALTFKRMTDVYEDAEFFASQWNVLLYTALATCVVAYKCAQDPSFLAQQRRCFASSEIVIMAALDSTSSVLSCVGGASTAGGVQNLINQTAIPTTLVLSRCCLGSRYSVRQICGAAIILVGALWAASSAAGGGGGGGSTTAAGATIFAAGMLPTAYSNVYKEGVFNANRAARRADVYYLTTVIAFLQVFLGFIMVPLLPLPAFGGTPLRDVGPQLVAGFECFLPRNHDYRSPIRAFFGDDDTAFERHILGRRPPAHEVCDEGFLAMITYVLVNFAYNVLQLLITKHSSAATLVMATALALPATSLMFSSPALVGRDATPFGWRDIAGLAVVVAGFVVYSAVAPDEDGVMPPQASAGSAIYVRRPRADSDPPTPSLLRSPAGGAASPAMPRRARATSFETAHHRSSPGDLMLAAAGGPDAC